MDSGLERRLGDLISQSFAEAHNRGKVSTAGAGLRSWSDTSRDGTGAALSAATNVAVTAGVTAILIAVGVAASIGTLGIAPIAAAAAALAAFGVSKLHSVATRSSRADKILERIRKGAGGEDGSFLMNWDEVKPTSLEEKVVVLAEGMFGKLIDDLNKLRDEVDEFLKFAGNDRVLSKLSLDPQTAISFLLQGESEVQRLGRHDPEKNRRTRPSSVVPGQPLSPYRGLSIYPLSTRSGAIAAPAEKALHRLRRIRFYIRWLGDYMALLEETSYDAVEASREAEALLVSRAAIQVSMHGNHGGCSSSLCFRATTTDRDLTPSSGQHRVSLSQAAVRGADVFGATSGVHEKTLFQTRAQWAGHAQTAGNKAFGGVVGAAAGGAKEAAAAQVGATVTKAMGEIAGSAATAGVGALIGDAISFGASEAYKRYTVSRPLQQRVRAVQEAMRTNDAGALDKEVLDKAKENDLSAVLASFLLAHSHYPKRVQERHQKLSDFMKELQQSAGRKPSPFSSCEHAAIGFRYLAKVYHQSEKLAIHCCFVRYCLEAIDQRIFVDGYRRMMRPVLDEIAGMGEADDARARLRPTETRVLDPLAVERLAGRQARAARENVAAATAATQANRSRAAAEEAFRQAFERARYSAQTTGINRRAFAGGEYWRGTLKVAVSDSTVLTFAEWKEFSSVAFKRRAGGTQLVDQALEPFLGQLSRMIAAARSPKEPSRETGMALSAELKRRAQQTQPLLQALNGWLREKEANTTSSRRPAIQQLQRLVEADVYDCNQAAAALDGALSALR